MIIGWINMCMAFLRSAWIYMGWIYNCTCEISQTLLYVAYTTFSHKLLITTKKQLLPKSMETERGRELSLHQSVTKSCEHVQLVVAIAILIMYSNRVLFRGWWMFYEFIQAQASTRKKPWGRVATVHVAQISVKIFVGISFAPYRVRVCQCTLRLPLAIVSSYVSARNNFRGLQIAITLEHSENYKRVSKCSCCLPVSGNSHTRPQNFRGLQIANTRTQRKL